VSAIHTTGFAPLYTHTLDSSTIAFVINLQAHQNLTLSQAYQTATRQFIKLRAIGEIANFAAEEEAIAYGEDILRDGSSRQAAVSQTIVQDRDRRNVVVTDDPSLYPHDRTDSLNWRLAHSGPTTPNLPPRHQQETTHPPTPSPLDSCSVPTCLNEEHGPLNSLKPLPRSERLGWRIWIPRERLCPILTG
jgi:hypothetical protein